MSTTDSSLLRLAVLGDTPLADDCRRTVRERVAGVIVVETGDATPADAVRQVEADAVIVATAVAARAGLIAAATARGLHVCCPLPVADDLPTLDGLIVRAAESGRTVFAPNLLRYWLPLARLHERRKAIGTPAALFAAHRLRRGPDVGDLFTDVALPLVDAALWVIEGVVERVQVMTERLYATDDGPADTAILLLTFAGGLTATLEVARSLPEGGPGEELLVEYLGLDAVLRAAPTNLTVEITGVGGTRAVDWLPSPTVTTVETFVAALRAGQGMPQSLIDARWSLAVLEKIRLAAVTGEMVRVGGGVVRR